jgi:IQ calmodulin-binding motif
MPPRVRPGWGTPVAPQRRANTARLEEAVRRIMNMGNLNNANRAQLNQTLRMLETRNNRTQALVNRARNALRAYNAYNAYMNNNMQPLRGVAMRQPNARNKAAVKIQAALRGWLARSKHLPKNKFQLVIGPNGVPMIAVKPTRLGVSVAKKAANMKQYNRYMNRLRRGV